MQTTLYLLTPEKTTIFKIFLNSIYFLSSLWISVFLFLKMLASHTSSLRKPLDKNNWNISFRIKYVIRKKNHMGSCFFQNTYCTYRPEHKNDKFLVSHLQFKLRLYPSWKYLLLIVKTFNLPSFSGFAHADFKSQLQRLWDIYITDSLKRCSGHYTENSNGRLLAH